MGAYYRNFMLIGLNSFADCQSGRIGADEEIDDTKGKTMEEVEEMIEERELKAGTQILEMVSCFTGSIIWKMVPFPCQKYFTGS